VDESDLLPDGPIELEIELERLEVTATPTPPDDVDYARMFGWVFRADDPARPPVAGAVVVDGWCAVGTNPDGSFETVYPFRVQLLNDLAFEVRADGFEPWHYRGPAHEVLGQPLTILLEPVGTPTRDSERQLAYLPRLGQEADSGVEAQVIGPRETRRARP
jgi:hypothetical protein